MRRRMLGYSAEKEHVSVSEDETMGARDINAWVLLTGAID